MRTIQKVSVENFLSFQKADVLLESLNVLVGPNGSGKTNFLRVFQFLGEVARRDLVPAIDGLGGFDSIRFRGDRAQGRRATKLDLQAMITEHASSSAPDEYVLSFSESKIRTLHPPQNRRLINRREQITFKRIRGRGRRITLVGGQASFAPLADTGTKDDRKISVQSQSSGLSTIRKLGEDYGASQVQALADVFEGLRLYEIDVDKARLPSSTRDSSRLNHDASNISAYLLWLSGAFPEVFTRLCGDVEFVLPGFVKFHFARVGGPTDSVVVEIQERHLEGYTPLGRASFGTIRAIALFAMLHDPNPPRLTCLEEVDHGLHPHALDRLVERLRDASAKTQIIVATHSPALVNRFEAAELRVFERDIDSGASRIVSLTAADIRQMQTVSGFELGELWFSGSLGGVL